MPLALTRLTDKSQYFAQPHPKILLLIVKLYCKKGNQW